MQRRSTLLKADLYGELGIEDVSREVWSLPLILPNVDQEKSLGLLGGLLCQNGEVTNRPKSL
jgi:hypothetical protein